MAVATERQSVRLREDRAPGRVWIVLLQLAIVCVFLAIWQWGVRVPVVRTNLPGSVGLFISSPSAAFSAVWHLLTGTDKMPLVWPYLVHTMEATLVGGMIGVLLGAVLGLIASSSRALQMAIAPFAVALNSIPRIALIPIVVLFFGAGIVEASINAAFLVIFISFFSAFEGGRSVPAIVRDNAALLGASRAKSLRYVLAPVVFEWVAGSLPNAISFALIAVVTNELLVGTHGMGGLLLYAMTGFNSALLFAVVVILSIVGLVLAGISELGKRKYIRWRA